mgnify:CR=1 FL=1
MNFNKCIECGTFLGKKEHVCKQVWNIGLKKENDIRLNHSEKSKIKLSNSLKKLYQEGKLKPQRYWLNKKRDKKTNEKISESLRGHISTEETNKKIGLTRFKNGTNIHSGCFKKGHEIPKEWKESWSESTKRRLKEGMILRCNQCGGFIGKEHNCRENINKMILSKLSKFKDLEYKEKVLKKFFSSLKLRPTSYEKQMSKIIYKYNLPYKYVGDGSFLIGYKNPDYININGEKICIEVYHGYFKIRNYGSIENYEKQRSEHFDKYGWKTIFINEDEILSKDENLILNKINGGKG